MISPTRRLILVALLAVVFFSWIGYLAFLAFNNRQAVVLSRQQVLAADLDLVAEVASLDQPVLVHEVLWPQKPEVEPFVGRRIPVLNLKACQADWRGSGLYLLPLVVKKSGDEEKFEVALPSQRMPGYDPGFDQGKKSLRAPRIYPANAETIAQLGQVTN